MVMELRCSLLPISGTRNDRESQIGVGELNDPMYYLLVILNLAAASVQVYRERYGVALFCFGTFLFMLWAKHE